MFPYDSVTLFREISGNVTVPIYTGGDNTVLSVALQQSNNSSDTELRCGNDVVAKNYATNFSAVAMNYNCTDDIILFKTGQDSVSAIITYVPYLTNDLATSTQYGYNPQLGISSSTDVQIYGTFTAGDIMISFLLFLIFFITLLYYLIKSLGAIKTKKRYIEYSSGDVPINEEL